MSSYKLNVKFKEEDLRTIAKAHQKLVLVKHTAGDGDTPVAWVSFKPWQYNTISWENRFAIYASNSEIQSGATINKLSDKIATSGVMYKFANGTFDTPVCIGDEARQNTYIARNCSDDASAITLGLAQNVVVNGRAFANNPINAVYVPMGQVASMTPIERVDIYLQNDILDSTVITHIQSYPLAVSYDEGEVEHTIAFNGAIGEFFLEN